MQIHQNNATSVGESRDADQFNQGFITFVLVNQLLRVLLLASSEEDVRSSVHNKWIFLPEWETAQSIWGGWANVMHLHQKLLDADRAGVLEFRVESKIVDVLTTCAKELKSIAHCELVRVCNEV